MYIFEVDFQTDAPETLRVITSGKWESGQQRDGVLSVLVHSLLCYLNVFPFYNKNKELHRGAEDWKQKTGSVEGVILSSELRPQPGREAPGS